MEFLVFPKSGTPLVSVQLFFCLPLLFLFSCFPKENPSASQGPGRREGLAKRSQAHAIVPMQRGGSLYFNARRL